jgi:hypothetical protein
MLLLREETLWRPFFKKKNSTVSKEQPRNHSKQPPVSRENIQQRCQKKLSSAEKELEEIKRVGACKSEKKMQQSGLEPLP